MEEKHVSAVTAIGRQCFSEPWSEAAVRGELQNPHGSVYVCCDGETVAGYVSIAFVLDEGSINNIAVLPRQKMIFLSKPNQKIYLQTS